MLNASALPDDVVLCDADSRGRMVEVLVSEFRTAFADIEYEVDTQTRIVNAQAFLQSGRRFVRLYGGLVLHPLTNDDALVFSLLHETGHHIARGRRFAGDPSLACDCLADKWACGAGARELRRRSGRILNLTKAFRSLDDILAPNDVGSGSASRRRSQQPQACWANFWSTRKSRLSDGGVSEPTDPCYFY
ncbi:hypothetical protein [Bradyrhizobium sp. LTSPM299]|uniref:hypothetical protein n=1 Tax=Bradyrhizobium sp. LTSPM299 TaxID=1619233 RepID=UPI0012E2D04F|nr:hypothetical protein [Bradyrhizobium sp. LTSPM299]